MGSPTTKYDYVQPFLRLYCWVIYCKIPEHTLQKLLDRYGGNQWAVGGLLDRKEKGN